MAKKGEVLTRINVDLGKALDDWMKNNGNPKAVDMARILHLKPTESGRIKEILDGQRNTQLFLDRIVKFLYEGDYRKMVAYCGDTEAVDRVNELDFITQFNKLPEREKKYILKLRDIQRKLILDHKAKDLLEAMQKLDR